MFLVSSSRINWSMPPSLWSPVGVMGCLSNSIRLVAGFFGKFTPFHQGVSEAISYEEEGMSFSALARCNHHVYNVYKIYKRRFHIVLPWAVFVSQLPDKISISMNIISKTHGKQNAFHCGYKHYISQVPCSLLYVHIHMYIYMYVYIYIHGYIYTHVEVYYYSISQVQHPHLLFIPCRSAGFAEERC